MTQVPSILINPPIVTIIDQSTPNYSLIFNLSDFARAEKITLGQRQTLSTITVALIDLASTLDNGILTVSAGTSGANVSGSGTNSVTLTGTLAQINDLLNTNATSGVSFTANTDTPPASTTLTVGINDGGNSGSGGALTGSANQTINITAIDDGPVAVVDTLSAVEDTPITYAAEAIFGNDTDVDGGPKVITGQHDADRRHQRWR